MAWFFGRPKQKKIAVRILAKGMFSGNGEVVDGFIVRECFDGVEISDNRGNHTCYGEMQANGDGVFPLGCSEIYGWQKWEYVNEEDRPLTCWALMEKAKTDEAMREFREGIKRDETALQNFIRGSAG